MPASDPFQVPARMRTRYAEIIALSDSIAREHLNEEYAEMSRRMAAALARRRPSPLERGDARIWAAAIVASVGFVNFLGDPAQEPHMTMADLAQRAGVGLSTLASKSRQVRQVLDLGQLDPEWTIPSMIEQNPYMWILLVDGVPMDVRRAPREVQEQAFRQGLIPFIPADGPRREVGASGGGGGGASGGARRGALRAVPGAGPGGKPAPETAGERVYQLKITLDEVRPTVWRRVLVPADTTLLALHRVIQVAMGWQDYHLWRFQIGGTEYGKNLGGGWGPPPRSAQRARLGEVASTGDTILYEYDFGDSWQHRVRVEKVLPSEPGQSYPRCIAGARACPPEDCGGPWGYEQFLESIADPAHPEHDTMLEWAGGEFDPEAFDADAVNRKLTGAGRGGGRKGGSRPRLVAAEEPEDTAGDEVSAFQQAEGAMRDLMSQAQAMLQRTLEENPGADMNQLNEVLRTVSSGYNARPQADLGGLSPAQVRRLIDADWESPDSAVRLDASLPLAEIENSRMLHNARLFLRLLHEQGEVKATPKGNLPRAFVAAFREHMQWDSSRDEEWYADRKILNEEDVGPLHVMHILLDLGGLIKRRKGMFSLTKLGQKLLDDARAGELFATLFRTYFRRFNLAYVDGVGPVPGFQHTVAVTLQRFGTAGGEWKAPEAIGEEIVLPSVREEVPRERGFSSFAILMETRFLRPLAGFGLAEAQELPREQGSWRDRVLYRKSPLFDRFLHFDVGG